MVNYTNNKCHNDEDVLSPPFTILAPHSESLYKREILQKAGTNQWSHVMRKPVLPYANNKGADQPAHLSSLISAFVVRCLDSIISLVSISEI